MSALYISPHEVAAIKAIDVDEIRKRVEQALDRRCASDLYHLNLSSCGQCVSNRLRQYVRDLEHHSKAKAAKKFAETRTRAWSAGHDLVAAIREMKERVEEQEKETELIVIDDVITSPYRFSDRIKVRVNYQWRTTVKDQWIYGSVTFAYGVDMRPDYSRPQPKRKLSAAKQEDQRQEALYGHWESLRTLAIQAVRKFLKSGGDGSKIPETFEAKPARYDRYLNNLSCEFWRADVAGDTSADAMTASRSKI